MPRARSLWIAALPLLACVGSVPPSEPATAPETAPETTAALRMPAAQEFVALSDPSYGHASFAAGAPAQGDRAPDFELPTHAGASLRLYDALAEGPVLLMFYRGFW